MSLPEDLMGIGMRSCGSADLRPRRGTPLAMQDVWVTDSWKRFLETLMSAAKEGKICLELTSVLGESAWARMHAHVGLTQRWVPRPTRSAWGMSGATLSMFTLCSRPSVLPKALDLSYGG